MYLPETDASMSASATTSYVGGGIALGLGPQPSNANPTSLPSTVTASGSR